MRRTLEDNKGVSMFASWESITFRSHSLDNFLNKNYISPSYLLKYIYQPGLNSCHHQPKIKKSFTFFHSFDWFQPRLFPRGYQGDFQGSTRITMLNERMEGINYLFS